MSDEILFVISQCMVGAKINIIIIVIYILHFEVSVGPEYVYPQVDN